MVKLVKNMVQVFRFEVGDLASDTATSVDVVLDALDRLGVEGETFEYVALLSPTSPLMRRTIWIKPLGNHSRRSFVSVVGVSGWRVPIPLTP